MKKLIKTLLVVLPVIVLLFVLTSSAEAATRVRGYYKPSTGTYVQPYTRSSPNSTRYDNYSTRGNYNPYTGKRGYASPYTYRNRW